VVLLNLWALVGGKDPRFRVRRPPLKVSWGTECLVPRDCPWTGRKLPRISPGVHRPRSLFHLIRFEDHTGVRNR